MGQSIQNLYQNEQQVIDFVEFCSNHREIFFITLGKNLPVCEAVCAVARSLGLHWYTLCAVSCMHGESGVFDDGDGMVFVSKNGQTTEVLKAMLQYGVDGHQYFLTCNLDVDVGVPTVHLDLDSEASPFNLAPMASMSTFMIFLNGIMCDVFEQKGITKERYQRNHPAGAIGKALRDSSNV